MATGTHNPDVTSKQWINKNKHFNNIDVHDNQRLFSGKIVHNPETNRYELDVPMSLEARKRRTYTFFNLNTEEDITTTIIKALVKLLKQPANKIIYKI